MFNLAGPVTQDGKAKAPVVITDEEDRNEGKITPTTELLIWHSKFGHIEFAKLQAMAQQGIIPKRLAKCNVPTCSSCMYAKGTKRPRRGKTIHNDPPSEPLKPGDIVSANQMLSPVPGLIAQMTGLFTKKRYKYVTLFVDQASRQGYVYLQKTASAEEMILAKRAYKLHSSNQAVIIKAYHANNGIFKANDWVKECRDKRQPLTFAGVNAHHQNRIAERRIRELQELARTILVHANRRWPKAVTANLLPYAI
jgi:hypothetical protein